MRDEEINVGGSKAPDIQVEELANVEVDVIHVSICPYALEGDDTHVSYMSNLFYQFSPMLTG